MARVRKTETCWLWLGAKARGYGYIWRGGRVAPSVQVHRAVWALVNGPIPDGLLVCHHCDVPNCVNPAHLFLGTHSDNALDAVNKGRWRGGNRRGPKPYAPTKQQRLAAIDRQIADLREELAVRLGAQQQQETA